MFPDDIFDVFDLVLLADEFFLDDLKRQGEEELMIKLNVKNIIKMLILFETNPIISSKLQDKAKTMFINEFEEIYNYNPNLENDIKCVPGLMTKLF